MLVDVLGVIKAIIENHIVAPTFTSRFTSLPPSAVLITCLIGIKSGGLASLCFALPVVLVV
jgi:predicted PurR-regulated permease PerM